MAKLVWSPRALEDLEAIREYIGRDSDRYARLFVERAIQFVESIPLHPLLGAIVPEYRREELRERYLQNYRIVYRLQAEMVEIVTVVHAARLLPPV